MPGSSVTIERRWPIRRLNSVDFPTFGRPTIAISGSEGGMTCSGGLQVSLSFCKIAHQMFRDLSCLPMIYSRIIETDREFENIWSEAVQALIKGRGVVFRLSVWEAGEVGRLKENR